MRTAMRRFARWFGYLNETTGQICRVRDQLRLNRLAQHIEAKASWDDVELPEETRRLFEEICEQAEQRKQTREAQGYRHKMSRGSGIKLLFYGDNSSSKLIAAEAMAQCLQIPLYRVDLSALVNKYIGEIEKNLRRVFNAAENAGVILFFDEADALFGKRSEVKDSHDRYANIEINYLSRRMEAFCGLVILAAKKKTAFDEAALQRMHWIVNFPTQGEIHG
jgi:SpoVK/Ycf46/Vps4 family AAA+-type ATPase